MSSRDELMWEIGKEIGAYQNAVQRFDELAAARMNLHSTDLQIIERLVDGALPAGKVGEAAGISPAAATAAIDRLEATGYAKRGRSDQDRRVVIVELTAKSRRLVGQIWGPLVQEGLTKLEGYSTKELTLLRDFVRWCREVQQRHTERVRSRTG